MWTFGNCWREPINGGCSEGEDFREVLDLRVRDSREGSLVGYGITILVHQNFERHNRRTLLQGAQTGQTSHPPNPGAPRRALRQARPQLLPDPRFTFRASRFTAPGSDARTPLVACFSTLLEQIADQLDRLFRRGSGMDVMRREVLEQVHPGLIGSQKNYGLLGLQRQCDF
jgi:hypothetical protein